MPTPRAETSDVFRNFMTQPLHGEELKQGDIPEVGASTIKKLAALKAQGGGNFDVTTPQKLMGLFCVFNRSEEEFAAFLASIDVAQHHARKIAEGLGAKTQQFCNDEPYNGDTGGLKPLPDGTSVVAQNFGRNPLSTARLNKKGGVVPGLATKVGTVESRIRTLVKSLGGSGAGTASTLQLLGMFLLMGEADWRTWLEDVTSKKYVETTTNAMRGKAEAICGDKVTPGSGWKPGSGNMASRVQSTLAEESEVPTSSPPVRSPDPVRNLDRDLRQTGGGGGGGQVTMAIFVVVLALLAAFYFRIVS